MKKGIFIKSLLAVVLAAGMASCSDEGREIAQSPLTVKESKVDFASAGGEGKIVVSSTSTISKVESSDSWCKATSDGAYTVNLEVDEQLNLDNRMAMITITDGEGNVKRVAVTQGGLKFNLYDHRVVVGDAGNPEYVRMEATGRTHFQDDISWLHPVATGDSLILTAEPNNTGNIRAGMVHITCGNKEDSIYVIQGEISDIVGDYYLVGYSDINNPGPSNLAAQDVKVSYAGGDSLTFSFPKDWNKDLKCNMYFDKENFSFIVRSGTYLGQNPSDSSYPIRKIGLWSKNNWRLVRQPWAMMIPDPIADNLYVCANCPFYTTPEGYVKAPLERHDTWGGSYQWSTFAICRYTPSGSRGFAFSGFSGTIAIDAYFIKKTPGIPEYTVKN